MDPRRRGHVRSKTQDLDSSNTTQGTIYACCWKIILALQHGNYYLLIIYI